MPPTRFLTVLLLFAAVQTHASPLNAHDETEFLTAFPIVLTPSRLAQPLNEAPAAMTVIDRAMIQASGYRDLPRLLRLVPGMQVGQERGNSHWVTYHGMGNDFPSRMQVLVDGRSVFSPGNFNGVDWAGLPVSIDEIERIEVLRGTNSVAFGSNAFLGVINIITRDSTIDPGTRATLRIGSAGIRDVALELGAAGMGSGWRLNAEARRDDGFADLNDGSRFALASLRADKRLGNNDEIMVHASASSGRRGLGYPDSTFNNNGERDSDSLLSALHLQWKHAPRAQEEWLLHYYRNDDRTTDEWLAAAQLGPIRAEVPLNRNRSTVRDNVEMQHRIALSDRFRALWGLELRRDRVNAPFLFHGAADQHSDLKRLFAQGEWAATPAWTINVSALIEKFDSDAARVSPRLFANWQLAPKDTLRLGYARAALQPSLFERHGDIRAIFGNVLLVQPFLPNPELKASRIDSVEMGYLAQMPSWNARLDLRLFEERISDFVTRVSHPEFTAPLLSGILPSARYENLGPAITLRGIEYQLEQNPYEGTRILFSHTLIDRRSDEPSVTNLTAPYSASLNWFQEWNSRWSSMLGLYCLGPLAGGTGFVPRYQYASRAYTTIDARLARHSRFGGTPLELALVATNLGGRHQEIADRSEQFLHGNDPVNRTSPMVWLTLSISSK